MTITFSLLEILVLMGSGLLIHWVVSSISNYIADQDHREWLRLLDERERKEREEK